MERQLQDLAAKCAELEQRNATVPSMEARAEAAEAALRAQPDVQLQRQTVTELRTRVTELEAANQAANAELRRVRATAESVELLQERVRCRAARRPARAAAT